MADYDYRSRQIITERRQKELKEKVSRLPAGDQALAQKILDGKWISAEEFCKESGKRGFEKPSSWFYQKGIKSSGCLHQELLDVFVPKNYQQSYLYIIDKLNQFPFTRGLGRRCVRTADYTPQVYLLAIILKSYEKLFFFGEKLENYILRRMDEEKLDYVRYNRFNYGFSYLYAAEIDLGNQAVIHALKELMLSENNTAYLDWEMILGILRSDSRELQELLGKLLVAARLQEGLRQVICESMDAGTPEAFLLMLKVVEDHDLIRFSAVKRAVFTWIGIYQEDSVDRISQKLLELMEKCLKDQDFCKRQLASDDTVAINTGLWALGFWEAKDAVHAMGEIIDHGNRHQKLAASFYNLCLYDETLQLKTARKVLKEHFDDLELTAAFMPALSSSTRRWIRDSFEEPSYYTSHTTKLRKYKTPELTKYYSDRQEAEQIYGCFEEICTRLPKKGICYDPFVFPWHHAELHPSEILIQMAFLAWLLQDEVKITAMAKRLGEISDGYIRTNLMILLLHTPSGREQRTMAIEYMGNAHTHTSDLAIQIVKQMTIQDKEYLILEDMLRFKRGNLRNTLIEFLMGQPDVRMPECLGRLLSNKKEEKRSAGLDIMLRLSRDPDRSVLYESVKSMTALVAHPTDKEKILIQELKGESGKKAEEKKGYGLYNPEEPEELLTPLPESPVTSPEELYRLCMPVTEEQAIQTARKLDHLIAEHKDYEYTASNGEKYLLGNALRCTEEGVRKKGPGNPYDSLEYYPLAELFQRFYEEEIRDYRSLVVLEAVTQGFSADGLKAAADFYKQVFGCMPLTSAAPALDYPRQTGDVRTICRRQFLDKKVLFDMGIQVVSALLPHINTENIEIKYQMPGWNGRMNEVKRLICEMPLFTRYFEGLKYWETDEEFTKAFDLAWRFEKRCRVGRKRRDFIHAGGGIRQESTITGIRPYWFLKAYHMGLISEDILCRSVMEYFAREDCLSVLCKVAKGECVKPLSRRLLNSFFGEEVTNEIYTFGESYFAEDTWVGALIRKLYQKIVPVLVDTELRRGEAETEFSWDMRGISYICGIDYLVRILMALGNDKLGKNSYYSWYYGTVRQTKKDVLSSLLKACYPAAHETGADLREAVKGARIREDRFVETAMYAPQWIDIIQEYLGWEGLKSGCYYFMAHMNERFDDQKKAVIARYTPLTPEELQDGAFDVTWFEEAYGQLGDANFTKLYQAAKYISDGQKHSRARKYADAATGKVELTALAQEITAKRNKDLLMSYGLVPFRKDQEQDMLERYQFIEQYRKESRQFGAQRRASEGKTADIALVNLSVRAGYEDVTRLKLTMEARMVEAMAPLMEWTAVEDVELCLSVDEEGKSKIRCRKNEKELKSVPSRIGKQPHVLKLKEAHKNLKEQYSRTKKMMEESMESGALFRGSELRALYQNPVVHAILKSLVYVCGQQFGFLKMDQDFCLELSDGSTILIEESAELRIAHPLDLYRSGIWHDYQKHMFDHRIRQPFKQVFRELYVKLPEEMGLKASRMFAGNQIQPQKTAGCLKGRRWVPDYEEGLQKIYYKENIVARIYALADWFSPSDIEAPTLEWVEFFNRKTFESLTMREVPDLIYSEVMRDVDLAVSVAHAGGVDPETSHSTIEMRRVIAELNLSLFGLQNVTLTDSHALIQGTRANYNVHLGSGVVHQEGGAMLHILPVHSQKRGRIFLPFVDEDPKTAEIMSKIILLAEDKKIKDPSILDQIR